MAGRPSAGNTPADQIDPAEALAVQEAVFQVVSHLARRFDEVGPDDTDTLLEIVTGRPIGQILGYATGEE